MLLKTPLIFKPLMRVCPCACASAAARLRSTLFLSKTQYISDGYYLKYRADHNSFEIRAGGSWDSQKCFYVYATSANALLQSTNLVLLYWITVVRHNFANSCYFYILLENYAFIFFRRLFELKCKYFRFYLLSDNSILTVRNPSIIIILYSTLLLKSHLFGTSPWIIKDENVSGHLLKPRFLTT